MTSRRSRLKAVTNLPVRRKVLAVEENTNGTLVENLTSKKIFSSIPKSNEISATVLDPNHIAEKNLNDIVNKNNGSDLVNINCTGFQKNERVTIENGLSKNIEGGNSDLQGSDRDITKTCNFPSCKTDSKNESVFNSNYSFQLNSVSSPQTGEPQVEVPEKRENEILVEQNSIINFNTNNNNNNNNIVKDGFKCYTVLTPQSVPLSSIAEYTIASLASCGENYIDTNVNDINVPQEFQEIQIYTEVVPAELYINNEIIDNNQSLIETEHLTPVLTRLTNYNCEHEVNSVNFESVNPNVIELENNSETLVTHPEKKDKTFNGKSSFKENKECKSSVTKIQDSHRLERPISSDSFNVSSGCPSGKQVAGLRRKRAKYNEFTKKLADAKREFQKKYEKTKPDRNSLKMIDLIFYNPSSNPMESKVKYEKKDVLEPNPELVNDLLVEEKVDEPELIDYNLESNMLDNETENGNKMPVPQVKIGLDGEIILDEKSLIIETTDAKKGRQGLQNSVPIFEDKGCRVSYYKGKSKKSRDWTDFETKRFYKALNTIGPDFSLMQKYFPKRSRLELKNKFKREERLNRNLVDKALNNPSEFDMTQIEKDLAVEKEVEESTEMRFSRIIKQTVKKPKIKSSFLSREMIEPSTEMEKSKLISFELDSKMLLEDEKNKKEKEFDFIFHKLLMKESEKSDSILPEISLSPNSFKGSNHHLT